MPFQINDKVVCIDDDFTVAMADPSFEFVGPLPRKNAVYTVEKLFNEDGEGSLSIRVTGATVFYHCKRGRIETGFRCVRFRKLEEVKQSVPKTLNVYTYEEARKVLSNLWS